MDNFLVLALAGGLGVAVVAGPLGSLVVWRRMAYFGDTLSHSGLLGISLGLFLNINPVLGLIVTCILIAGLLFALEGQRLVPTDSLLGILSHTSLSAGLIALGMMDWVRVDLNALLFGDILSLMPEDIFQIYLTAAIALIVLQRIWPRLILMTLSTELAEAEGIPVNRTHLIFLLVMAVTIAMAMKVVGILLITALLIIPAASARQIASSPESMAIMASGLGMLAVITGLAMSWFADVASGPAIVLSAAVFFALSLIAGYRLRMRKSALK